MKVDKKSFILYTSNYEAIKNMSFEEKGMLLEKIFCYQLNIDSNIDNVIVDMAFNFIKPQLDTNNEKYQKKVEANRNNGKLGGRPKETQKKPKNPVGYLKTQQNPKNLDNDNDNVNDNVNVLDKSNIKEKKKYGEFKNVLLTDEEFEKLKIKFKDYENQIENLSIYISSTGKKYNSHYATILSWDRKNNKGTKKNVPEWFDKTFVKEEEPEFETEEEREKYYAQWHIF